jgi:uncharacterized membrane protein
MAATTTPRGRETGRRARFGLAALMLGAGVTHFVAPAYYEKIVPRWAGDARRCVLASGVAELACGTLLLRQGSARVGGWLTAALLVVVFPANVQMLLDAGTEHQAVDMPVERFRVMALARLPLQLPLVVWATRVARRSAAGA